MYFEVPRYSGGNPREALGSYVKELYRFLAALLETNRTPAGEELFFPELLDGARRAWSEVRPHFSDLISRIENRDVLTDDNIFRNGLHGPELEFKFSVVGFWNRQHEASGDTRFLRRLFGVIDDLLRSIIKACGGGDAVEEIKDFIMNSIKALGP